MKIIVDAMGGDNAPQAPVMGAVQANREYGVDIILVGRGEAILKVLEENGIQELPAGVEIAHASEVVEMCDNPATAFREKKDSSLTVGLNLLKDGSGDAFVSAGSTGALLAAATLLVKRIRGIRRAALAPVVPTGNGGAVLIDCGANAECPPEYLMQFAYMGSYYAEHVLGRPEPRVGLLNIGVEAAKGNEQAQAAYALKEKPQPFHFIGNVEARDALAGKADVVAADGFVGNVLLKNTEGVISMIFGLIKGGLMDSTKGKLAALLAKDTFRGIKRSFDSTEIGGAPLLGVEGAVIKAHGNSNARAIFCAIRQARSMVDGGVVDVIRDEVAKLSVGEEQA